MDFDILHLNCLKSSGNKLESIRTKNVYSGGGRFRVLIREMMALEEIVLNL